MLFESNVSSDVKGFGHRNISFEEELFHVADSSFTLSILADAVS